MWDRLRRQGRKGRRREVWGRGRRQRVKKEEEVRRCGAGEGS